MSQSLPDLPLSPLREAFERALRVGSLLLEAEPGAGKSTLAPLWALDNAEGQVWLIQPRVLPTMTLAHRLAEFLGEKPGQTVGYQVPFDRQAGPDTRLLLMTPGVLLQRLLADPELEGVATVMLDEIHERAVDQDTAWALLQEAAILRDDLNLVLMSATPDAKLREQVETSLYAPGRCFEVSVDYCPPKNPAPKAEPLTDHLMRALAAHPGWREQTVLVFLPGWRAIDDCRRALQQSHPTHPVYCLHSRVERAEQTRALDPALGPRMILATNIAETSLTIADVTLVVDSGLAREPEFEQRTGVTRLNTRRIAAANAEQRRGRAGRVRAGHCIRLWAESESLAPQTLPEIRRTDYLPLTLRLAHWGTPADQLPWLEPPSSLALAHSRSHLERWGLLDKSDAITERGGQVARLGTHPRVAALLLHSGEALGDHPWLLLLALALHFDLPTEPALADWLERAGREYRQNTRWRQMSKRWQKVLGVSAEPAPALTDLPGALVNRLASVFADRLGHRGEGGRYRLNTGVGVTLAERSEWALVLQVAARGREQVGVGLAIEPDQALIRELAEAETAALQTGSGKHQRWVERTRYRLGGKVVDESERRLEQTEVPEAILSHLRQSGLAGIRWPAPALVLLARARLAVDAGLLSLPPLDESHLNDSLDDWLGGFISVDTDPDVLPLKDALTFYIGFEADGRLDELLPERLTLPSGRSLRVDYLGEADTGSLVAGTESPEPRIAAKLQEFLGTESLPLGQGTVPLVIELLSPAGRPVAITRDLAYFWKEVYPQVRRELRGRYAKHPWPEDPLAHSATGLTKRRLGT